jgi:hypothetical protein
MYELAVKETTACAFPAVAETLVGAVGVPPPRDAFTPIIAVCVFYPAIVLASI